MKTDCDFHGYTIMSDGRILSKRGEVMQFQLRKRRGKNNKYDKVILLRVNGKQKKFTISNLVLAAFDGPMFGYEANHLNRDPMDCRYENLERATPKANQKHWRDNERMKNVL